MFMIDDLVQRKSNIILAILFFPIIALSAYIAFSHEINFDNLRAPLQFEHKDM